MKRLIALLLSVVVVAGLAGGAVYWYVSNDAMFYARHNATFGDLKEMQYNGKTFMAVFYEPSSDLSQKAAPVFKELAKELEIPVVAVDIRTIEDGAKDLLLKEKIVTPTFFYFKDGFLRMVVEGYYPLEIYKGGLKEAEKLLTKEQSQSEKALEQGEEKKDGN